MKNLILKLTIFFFVFGIILFPTKVMAREEIISCSYNYQDEDGINNNLNYKLYDDNSLKVAFNDGVTFGNSNKQWYHSSDFVDLFINASLVSKNTYACPLITADKTDKFVTLYPSGLSNSQCKGKCYSLTSSTKLSDSAKESGVKSTKVVSSCKGSDVAVYNSKKYFYPYFRTLKNGSKQWSIDGSSYFDIDDTILFTANGTSSRISLNNKFKASVFTANGVSCSNNIYRCVNKKSNNYIYELSTYSSYCTNDELGANDGQGFGSNSVNGALGDPSNTESNSGDDLLSNYDSSDYVNGSASCNSILGDASDEDSVAWLLQEILNYIKILGPILVIVLSGIDFAKAIVVSDEENMRKTQKKFIIRLLAAALLFLLPNLVTVLLQIFGITSSPLCNLK